MPKIDKAPRGYGGGSVRRSDIYNKIAYNAYEIIDYLFETMRNKDAQDSVRMSAANKLIDKILPNLKSTELVNEEGSGGFKVIIQDYGHNNNASTQTEGSVPEKS